jgi:hypothetical protein
LDAPQLKGSRKFDLISSLPASCAKALSRCFSQFLDSSKNVAFNCGVRAATAISAQRAACLRHSFGLPGINIAHKKDVDRVLRDLALSQSHPKSSGCTREFFVAPPDRPLPDAAEARCLDLDAAITYASVS